MPIARTFSIAATALLALLLVSDALFGETPSRFDRAHFDSATYAPSRAAPIVASEVLFTPDATPAARVRDVFARFGPNDPRRDKRYSSLATMVR
jgi:hypothetical protein